MNHSAIRALTALLLCLLLLAGCGSEAVQSASEEPTGLGDFGSPAKTAEAETETAEQTTVTSGSGTLTETDTGVSGLTERDSENVDGAGIYTYLQTINAYKDGLDWSGEWCYIQEPGSSKHFSSFGCGICCLANLYSTLTPDECTPGDMYQWAKEVSDYAGDGAISWGELETVSTYYDFPGQLCNSGEYSDFQAEMASAKSLLVLVSSYYDDVLWPNMPGHYVTLWEYDAATDTVFLADSGRPHNNRTRVALEDVFNALDLSDKYQYMKFS